MNLRFMGDFLSIFYLYLYFLRVHFLKILIYESLQTDWRLFGFLDLILFRNKIYKKSTSNVIYYVFMFWIIVWYLNMSFVRNLFIWISTIFVYFRYPSIIFNVKCKAENKSQPQNKLNNNARNLRGDQRILFYVGNGSFAFFMS